MDIVEELKTISLEKRLAKIACGKISEDYAKKTHLFKVLEFAYLLEELVDDSDVEEMDIKKIIIFTTDNVIEPINFYIHNSTDKIIFLEAHTDSKDSIKELEKLLSDVTKISKLEYTNCVNYVSKAIELEVKVGIGKEATEYLLSNELKAILEYSVMQLELDSKEDKEDKSLKI